jgi:hypothetical protein
LKKKAPFLACEWIRPLATPYLRGYRAAPERTGNTRGYYFLHPGAMQQAKKRNTESTRWPAGFFVGYLVDVTGFEFLSPQPPECLVYILVGPPGSNLHRTLVSAPGSLLRKTFDYIRLLTHRPPRFVFHESEQVAMVRHQSMTDWPPEKYEHFSRNFFIETLAWLVRSGIVRKLLAEPVSPGETKRNSGAGRREGRPGKSRQKNSPSN